MLRQLVEELCDLERRTTPWGCQSLMRAVTAKWSGGLSLARDLCHIADCRLAVIAQTRM